MGREIKNFSIYKSINLNDRYGRQLGVSMSCCDQMLQRLYVLFLKKAGFCSHNCLLFKSKRVFGV